MNLLGGTLRKKGLNKFIFSDFRDFFQFLEKKKIFIMKNGKKNLMQKLWEWLLHKLNCD